MLCVHTGNCPFGELLVGHYFKRNRRQPSLPTNRQSRNNQFSNRQILDDEFANRQCPTSNSLIGNSSCAHRERPSTL